MASNRPSLFIGSSQEGLPIVEAFREALRENVDCVPWNTDVFKPSHFTLESLENALDRFSYALIVLSDDDIIRSRGNEEISARDNVIFELGLFVGRHGRPAVFFAVPDSVRLRLPTDVLGFTPVKYKFADRGGTRTYDVTQASAQIIQALQGRHTLPRRQPQPSPFWDVLSDQILILFGAEPEPGAHRHRVSLRDLETACELKTFLDHRYPSKHVRLIAATTPGLERVIQAGTDLVVVGGFVTNAEFAKHRARYEHFFRLKMGRLCIVDGQRVHVPQFHGPSPPDRQDAQAVENFPSRAITRDYGFVFNGALHIYGRDRRVVAIAGVKGHGTRGAELYLSDERIGVDTHLKAPLTAADTLELAVAVDVVDDVVDRIEPVSILLNEKPILLETKHSEPCELKQPCEGCTFGLFAAKPATRPLSRVKAIVFDLDDTLIDTFNSLIVPLELEAANAMVTAGLKEDPITLASNLLHLRRTNPANLEAELRKAAPGVTRRILATRNRLLTKVPLSNVLVSPEIMQLLRRLRNEFDLYLLTAGVLRFQNRKIEQLKIRGLFRETLVIAESSHIAKANALQTLAERRGLRPENVLVVGNRLDNEISAGNVLGMPTIWIRHGEGSDVNPESGRGQPDYTLAHVREISSLL